MALVRCGAKMAGLGKAGAFGDTTHLRPGREWGRNRGDSQAVYMGGFP